MTHRMNRAWILSLLLWGGFPAGAQGLAPTPAPVPSAVDTNWNRLRSLMSFLITEEGTRKVYATHRGIGEAFISDDQFSYFVAPWRPRLFALPNSRQEAPDVDLEVLPKADGTTICLMTYHHQQPVNAITIVKTVWMDEGLLKVVFMKGFSHITDDNAERNRMHSREEAYRQLARPAPARK